MQLEIVKRDLWQAFEICRQLSSFGIWFDRADKLCIDTKSRGDLEQTVLVARLRFANIDGASQRPREGLEFQFGRCRSWRCQDIRQAPPN